MKSISICLQSAFVFIGMLPLLGGCAVETSTDASSMEEEETATAEQAILDCSASYTHPAGTTYSAPWASGQQANGTLYTLWSNNVGTGKLTVYNDLSSFKATWNNPSTTQWSDFLARVGPALLGQKPSDFSFFKVGYKVALSAQSNNTSAALVAAYGWGENVNDANPLREYYIVDNWVGSRPSGTYVTTFNDIYGQTYDVYKHKQINQPTIKGTTEDFWQYFSVRKTPRSCGYIDILGHYNKWASVGMPFTKLYEAKLLVESYGKVSVGTADFQYANFAQGLN